jgi:hypothetical protein
VPPARWNTDTIGDTLGHVHTELAELRREVARLHDDVADLRRIVDTLARPLALRAVA